MTQNYPKRAKTSKSNPKGDLNFTQNNLKRNKTNQEETKRSITRQKNAKGELNRPNTSLNMPK